MNQYIDEGKNRVRQIVNWMIDIIVVISIAWFTVFALGTQISISGQSMSPTLESEEVVLMNRLSFQFKNPERFDIIVLKKDDNKFNVKRVLGLPGETLQVKEGLLYVNEELVKNEKGLNKVSLAGLLEHPVILGQDEYFVMGDYRDNSEDSRFANVGNIKRKQIIGKVWLRISPIFRFGLIRS